MRPFPLWLWLLAFLGLGPFALLLLLVPRAEEVRR